MKNVPSWCWLAFLISITGGVSASISNKEDLFGLNMEQLLNIKVTAGKKTRENIRDTAAYITVVTKEDIDLFGWRNLSEIIDALAGFMVFSDRIYDFVVPRGAYQSNDPNSRILLLLNGHSVVENFGYFNGQLATVDVNHIERIEVVRGPGSAVYGTNAMYAVINVITRKGNDSYGISVGSFSDKKIHGQKYFESGNWFLNTQLSVEQGMEESMFFDEYTSGVYPTGGFVSGRANRESKKTLMARAGNENVYVQLFHNTRKKYVPTGIFGGRIDQSGTFFEDENEHLEIGFESEFADYLNIEGRIFFDNYEFMGRYLYLQDPNGIEGPNYPSEYNRINSRSYGAELIADTNWSPHSRTIYGIEIKNYRDYDFVYRSENDPLQLLDINLSVNPNETVRSGFFSHEIRFYPSLRIDVGVHFDDYNSVGRYYSFRTALSYDFSSNSIIRLLYGESFRAPNSWELNGGFFLNGNENLEPETIQTYEATFDKVWQNVWQLHTSVFYYETENTIRTNELETFINGPGIEGYGFEVELNYRSNQWRGYGSISYNDVRNSLDESRVAFSAEESLKLGLSHLITDDWHVSVELKHYGDRLNPAEEANKQPSFTLVNAKVGDWVIAGKWKVDFSIKNVFDESYEHPAFTSDLSSFYLNQFYPVYDIPGSERRFWINVNSKW
ncbi:TonB-dependent receptor plug domain-containing protein [Pleionea sediminis]|uniref:TonB-dependent receptor plug domain-containing protein n=1 Tax=Pleionea sediminis TaxID=2569479 RepID=UPI0011872710|nr:TonB-dependent receptor [Pleionea sediminis]